MLVAYKCPCYGFIVYFSWGSHAWHYDAVNLIVMVLCHVCLKVPLESFEYLTRIHYRAANIPHDGMFGEHEIDYILFVCRDVMLQPNANEVSDYRYVTKEELKDMIGKSHLIMRECCKRTAMFSRFPHSWKVLDSVVYSGGDCVTASPFWPDREFWIIFALFLQACFAIWTVKCVPKLLPVKNCVKLHPKLSFWGRKWLFLGKGLAPSPHPTPSTPAAPRPLLPKILNMPLAGFVPFEGPGKSWKWF